MERCSGKGEQLVDMGRGLEMTVIREVVVSVGKVTFKMYPVT